MARFLTVDVYYTEILKCGQFLNSRPVPSRSSKWSWQQD